MKNKMLAFKASSYEDYFVARIKRPEPPRVSRRLVDLSQATAACPLCC